PAESLILLAKHSVDLSDLEIADRPPLRHLLYLVDEPFPFHTVAGGCLHLRQHERDSGVRVDLIGFPHRGEGFGKLPLSARARPINTWAVAKFGSRSNAFRHSATTSSNCLASIRVFSISP